MRNRKISSSKICWYVWVMDVGYLWSHIMLLLNSPWLTVELMRVSVEWIVLCLTKLRRFSTKSCLPNFPFIIFPYLPYQDMSNLPQMHLLSMRLEENLHKECPSNCKDWISWLPECIALNIFSFLDPGRLRCGVFVAYLLFYLYI